MGWTHYWTRPAELPADAFAMAVQDCRRAFALTAIRLAGPDGTGLPELADDRIAFNGAPGTGCETFLIRRHEPDRRGEGMTFSFCKTRQAPYDLCVQVALVIFKHHLGDRTLVESDGCDADWQQAREFCQEHLGYGLEFTLGGRAAG